MSILPKWLRGFFTINITQVTKEHHHHHEYHYRESEPRQGGSNLEDTPLGPWDN